MAAPAIQQFKSSGFPYISQSKIADTRPGYTTAMNDNTEFTNAIASAANQDEAYHALFQFTRALIGARLFTVMTLDMDAMLARRAYTNDPKNYPCSGTKPIEMNDWFDIIYNRRETFVANTLADISTVFPDHELIGSLGCGSVINLPVVAGGKLVATVNILHKEHHFTPARVSICDKELALPALASMLAAERLGPASPG